MRRFSQFLHQENSAFDVHGVAGGETALWARLYDSLMAISHNASDPIGNVAVHHELVALLRALGLHQDASKLEAVVLSQPSTPFRSPEEQQREVAHLQRRYKDVLDDVFDHVVSQGHFSKFPG